MQLLCYCLNKVLDLLRFRSFKMNWFCRLGDTGLLSQSDTIRYNTSTFDSSVMPSEETASWWSPLSLETALTSAEIHVKVVS